MALSTHPDMSVVAPRRAGFSLAEAVVAMLVVSIMLVAALNAVGSAARSRQGHSDRKVRAMLARQLLAEIMAARYQEPGGATGLGRDAGELASRRTEWDDVDDYDGWSASPPEDKDRNEIPNTNGWTRQVSVVWVDPADPNGSAASSETGLKRITVTVTDSHGKKATAVALRAQTSTYEQLPTTATLYLTGVEMDLQVGTDTTSRVSGGTNLVNRISLGPAP